MQPLGNFEVFALQKSNRINLVIESLESNISIIYVPLFVFSWSARAPVMSNILIMTQDPVQIQWTSSFSRFYWILSKIVNASVSIL